MSKTTILKPAREPAQHPTRFAKLSDTQKNAALCQMANALETNVEKILAANQLDVEAAKAKGMKAALLDRLALDQKKISNMAKELREVSAQADPGGQHRKNVDPPQRLNHRATTESR
jgi:glutamate-5-semialdehyde dehydrogenase